MEPQQLLGLEDGDSLLLAPDDLALDNLDWLPQESSAGLHVQLGGLEGLPLQPLPAVSVADQSRRGGISSKTEEQKERIRAKNRRRGCGALGAVGGATGSRGRLRCPRLAADGPQPSVPCARRQFLRPGCSLHAGAAQDKDRGKD